MNYTISQTDKHTVNTHLLSFKKKNAHTHPLILQLQYASTVSLLPLYHNTYPYMIQSVTFCVTLYAKPKTTKQTKKGKSTPTELEGNDDEDMLVAELVTYCKECSSTEKEQRNASMTSSSLSSDRSVDLEVLEALSHLGIYHHNFEHFKHGLILLKLCDELIKDLDTSRDDVKSVRTHVCFYLAQVCVCFSCEIVYSY